MNATATRTLAEVLTEREIDPVLYDWRSGEPIATAPEVYEVLASAAFGGELYLAARGPSGQIDVAYLSDGYCQLHRDTLAWPEELSQWVGEQA